MQPATATKPVYKLKNWWISDTHIYGQNIEKNNEYTRSPRIDSLRGSESHEYRHGDRFETHKAIYQIVGRRRMAFAKEVGQPLNHIRIVAKKVTK